MCLNAGAMGRRDAETETLIPTTGAVFDVAHALRGEGFDASEDGTGRGTPLVPIAFLFKDSGNDAALNLSPTLRSLGAYDSNGGSQMAVAFDTTQITSAANYSNPQPGDPCHPLAAHAHAHVPAIAIQAGALRENPASGPDGVGVQEGLSHTLEARAEVQAVAFQSRISRNGRGQPEEICPTLNGSDSGATSDMRPLVAQPFSIMPMNSGKDYKARPTDVAQPLMAGGPVGGNQGGDFIAETWAVRRLTPMECERLQGFPDGWTQVPHRGKPAADGPRYKAIGNSMAVNVMRWIGERIAAVDGAA